MRLGRAEASSERRLVMRTLSSVLPAVVVVTLLSVPAEAGIITFEAVEFKGTVIPLIPVTETFVSAVVIQLAPPPITIDIILNEEVVGFLAGPPIDIYNRYHAVIEIPQPPGLLQLIDIFWFMAADTGGGVGPLPPGAALLSAGLFGPRTGTFYPATVTPISDLAALPTSSVHDIMIGWDLTGIATTTGNFFLAQASIPVIEAVPEPATLALCTVGAVGAAAWRRRTRSRKQVA
jgi:hypothetical protein